jgi:type IV pilus assembly protein PilE
MVNSFTPRKLQCPQSGFTLVELMIVVIIASILAAYAIPTYRDHALQARIPEATSNLSMWRLQLEQYYQDQRNYGDAKACGVVINASANFTYRCQSVEGGQSYVLTATGAKASGMANFVFTLDQTGTATTTTLPEGWGQTPANCWVVKRGRGCP